MAPHQVGGSATPKPAQNTAELWDNLSSIENVICMFGRIILRT
ncbi:MAG: hypothetical protein Q6366_011345 [Candidatus Freyarchaeota archaeon]